METTQNELQETHNPVRVLVLSRQEYVIEKLTHLLTTHGYEATGCLADEQVLKTIGESDMQILLISGGFDPNRKMEIRKLISERPEPVVIVEHFGGPATLLQEIRNALQA